MGELINPFGEEIWYDIIEQEKELVLHKTGFGTYNGLPITWEKDGDKINVCNDCEWVGEFDETGKRIISNTTLVCVDCINVERAIKALEISLGYCSFPQIKLFTSLETDYKYRVKITNINSIEEYSKFMIKELWKYIETDYCLIIQHDGYILNPNAWNNNWYNFDYIGGICNWIDAEGKGGNGGFSFRSKKLLYAINNLIDKNKCHPEDISISSKYENQIVNGICVTGFRNELESLGLKFADIETEKYFSFDCGTYNFTFGHHKNNLSLSFADKLIIIVRYHDDNFISKRKTKSIVHLYNMYDEYINNNKIQGKFYLICDNISNEIYNNLQNEIPNNILCLRTNSLAAKQKYHHRGLYSFYISSINIALKECKSNKHNNYIFFCEDDYDYTTDIFIKAISQMKSHKTDFISLYDHPDRYMYGSIVEDNHPLHKPYKTEIIYDKETNHHWRTAISTCHSFACHWDALRDILYNTKIMHSDIDDHPMWVYIWNTKRHKLWTPIPGLSIHWGGPYYPLII